MGAIRDAARWLVLLSLATCGGSGTKTGPALSLSTTALTFSTISPGATPAEQTVTGSVSGALSGTLYIKVAVSGPAVATVRIDVSGSSGNANVVPAKASTLGPGTFSSTLTVSACLDDPTCATGQVAGSPATVQVSYQIASPVQGDAVAPRIAITNTAGDVVLRGNGFSQATVREVTFGGRSATAPPVRVSSTEIRASYPALPAGAHAIQLIGTSGPLPFAASIVVVEPPNYQAATLVNPRTAQEVRALLYDAERSALLVAVSYDPPAGNQILRYQFANGSWSPAPASVTIPELRDMVLSLDGSKILALSDSALTLVDPVSLALGGSTTFSFPFGLSGFEFFKTIALANDGLAIITTAVHGSGSTEPYLYSTSNPGFTSMAATYAELLMSQPISGASDDGSTVAFLPIDNPPAGKYVASTSVLSPIGFGLRQVSGVAPALDRSGTRMILRGNPNINGQTATSIYDGNFERIGGIVDEGFSDIIQAVAIAPDGTRAYVFDSSSNVRAFDLTQPTVGGLFPEIGTGTSASPGTGPFRMKTTPDGGTLFLAGGTAVVILPAP